MVDSDPRIEQYPDLDYLAQATPETINLGPASAEDYNWILRFQTDSGDSVGILLPPAQLDEMNDEFSGVGDAVKRLEMEIRREELEGEATDERTYSDKKRGGSDVIKGP